VFSSRRAFLVSMAGAAGYVTAAKGQVLPSESRRYKDAATEFDVYRLTDAAHQSWLPASYERAVSRRDSFLIYSSDRAGSVQAYRMDLKSGQSRTLTRAQNLVRESLTLSPDEHSFYYIDGRSAFMANLGNGHTRELHRIEDGFDLGQGFSVSEDGLYALLVEQKPGASSLRLITLRTGGAQTLAESPEPISDPLPRPRRAGVLYRRGDDLWLVNFDGGQNRKLRIAAGGLGPAVWSEDGRTILYLNFPSDPKQLNGLRECTPDTNEDRLLATTSQFISFGRNADSSVLVGASGSKASPYVLLLVRAAKRELTLCEHRASDPRLVAPIFSPNSQRVFFQSDKDGKLAIYSMFVDKLVEETEVEDK
jgi:oligogalacturonide lyase